MPRQEPREGDSSTIAELCKVVDTVTVATDLLQIHLEIMRGKTPDVQIANVFRQVDETEELYSLWPAVSNTHLRDEIYNRIMTLARQRENEADLCFAVSSAYFLGEQDDRRRAKEIYARKHPVLHAVLSVADQFCDAYGYAGRVHATIDRRREQRIARARARRSEAEVTQMVGEIITSVAPILHPDIAQSLDTYLTHHGREQTLRYLGGLMCAQLATAQERTQGTKAQLGTIRAELDTKLSEYLDKTPTGELNTDAPRSSGETDDRAQHEKERL